MVKKRERIGHKYIAWDVSVPDEIQATVGPLIKAYWHLLPGWLNEVIIEYTGDEDNNVVATTSGLYDYRFGRIEFTHTWLELSADARREIIVHEIIHLLLVPSQDQVQVYRNFVEKNMEMNAALVAMFEEQLNRGVEASTEDIAQAILLTAKKSDDESTEGHDDA